MCCPQCLEKSCSLLAWQRSHAAGEDGAEKCSKGKSCWANTSFR